MVYRQARGASALVLVFALLGIGAQAASAREVQVACPAERPTESAALVAARSCQGQVRIAGATTAQSTTWANPDGSLSTRMDAGPVRPLVTVAADGQTAAGARAVRAEERLSLAWKGGLPQPSINGDTPPPTRTPSPVWMCSCG